MTGEFKLRLEMSTSTDFSAAQVLGEEVQI